MDCSGANLALTLCVMQEGLVPIAVCVRVSWSSHRYYDMSLIVISSCFSRLCVAKLSISIIVSIKWSWRMDPMLVSRNLSYPDWRGFFFLDVSLSCWRSILTPLCMYGVGVYMLRSEIQNGILPGVHLIGLPGHWLRHQPNDCSSRILPITWTVVFTAGNTYTFRGADVGVRGHCLFFLITIH